MSRPVRIEFPGANHYVSCHAFQDLVLFHDDEDRAVFLSLLESVVNQFHWTLHGYVLLQDHFHLLVEVPQANLSRGMRQLNGVYTQHYNRLHKRTGVLFRGRFSSILFEKETYLSRLYRHMVLNPLRQKECTSLDRFKWSSHRQITGAARVHAFVSIEDILSDFGKRLDSCQKKYKAFVRAGVNESSPIEEKRHQILLGSDKFICQVQPLLNKVKNTKRKAKAVVRKKSLSSLFSEVEILTRLERNMVIVKAHLEHQYTLAEIGDHLGLHYTTVSKVISSK